ncbi:MAG: hypothetical protein NVSMB38_13490 [Ktedonobacteraceae bacterium]
MLLGRDKAGPTNGSLIKHRDRENIMNAWESSTYIGLGVLGLLWLLLPFSSKTLRKWFDTLPSMAVWDGITAVLFVGVGVVCTVRLFEVFKTRPFNLDPSLDPRFLGLLLLLLALLFL